MKVCFDANTVIDIALKSASFDDSFIAYDIVSLRHDEALLPVQCTPVIEYVLHRRGLSKPKTRKIVASLGSLFTFMDVIGADAARANESALPDYEDALIAFAAERNGVDVIVSANVKDFKGGPVRTITPAEFVREYMPCDYDYASVALS